MFTVLSMHFLAVFVLVIRCTWVFSWYYT